MGIIFIHVTDLISLGTLKAAPYIGGSSGANTRTKRSNFVSIHAVVSSADHPLPLPPLEFVNTKLNVDFCNSCRTVAAVLLQDLL